MKFTDRQYRTPHRWLVLTLLLVMPCLAFALESDKDQPIYIEADSVDIDDRRGTSTYRGNVELTQGTIRITADKITVSKRQGKSDHIEATGNPVTFRQKTDSKNGLVTGQAKKSEYDADSEVLYLVDQATLTQGKDTFKSDRIIYDRAKAVVKAGASAKGKQRVRVTIESKGNGGK